MLLGRGSQGELVKDINIVEERSGFDTHGFRFWRFFQEVRIGKDSKWKPGSIFVVNDIIYVADVRGKIKKSLLG